MTIMHSDCDHKRPEHDKLESDLSKFLARGGTIQVLPMGASSQYDNKVCANYGDRPQNHPKKRKRGKAPAIEITTFNKFPGEPASDDDSED